MADEPDTPLDPIAIARAAVETFVFAPIGLGAKIVEDAPAVVARVRQELGNAKFIGRLTVQQGASRLREMSIADAETNSRVAGDGPARTVETAETAETDRLPIDGYDEMPAIEIVSMLERLTPGERAVIEAHERANRRRRTVLGKIAQLSQ